MRISRFGLAAVLLASAGFSVANAQSSTDRASRNAFESGAAVVFPLGKVVEPSASFLAQGDHKDRAYVDQYLNNKTHLGADFPALGGTTVYAPVNGTIVYYQTRNAAGVDDPWNSLVVIRDTKTGTEHVLGHVQCTYCSEKGLSPNKPFLARSGISVEAGKPIGTVLTLRDPKQPGKVLDHLHWAVNTKGVVQSNGSLKPEVNVGGNWGQRYGETSSELAAARQQGWADPRLLRQLPANSQPAPARAAPPPVAPSQAAPSVQMQRAPGVARVGGISLSKAAAEQMAIKIDIRGVRFGEGHIVLYGPQNSSTRLDAAIFTTTLRMACERGYNARFSLDPDAPASWSEEGRAAMRALSKKIGESVNFERRPKVRDGLTVETYSLKRDFPKLWNELAPHSTAMRSKLVFGPSWLSNTRVGEILYKADVLLKDLTSGVSLTRPGQPSRTTLIEDYVSPLNRRAVLGLINDSELPKRDGDKVGYRMWFALMPADGARPGATETFDNPLSRLETADPRLRSVVLNGRYTGRSNYSPILKPAFYVSDNITDLSQIYPKMFMRAHDLVKGEDVEGSNPYDNVTLWDVNQHPERYMAVFEEMRDLADVFRAYVASVKIVQKDRTVCGILQRLPLLQSEKVSSALPAFHPSEVLATVAIWVSTNGRRRQMQVRYAMSHDGGISMHGAQFASQAELREETTVIREMKSELREGIKAATWQGKSGHQYVALKLTMDEPDAVLPAAPVLKRESALPCSGMSEDACRKRSSDCVWVSGYVSKTGLSIREHCYAR